MNLPETLLPFLLRAAVVMLAAMVLIRTLLWLLNIRSPVIHRWSSVVVLLQGWIFAPLVIAIPWYDPPETVSRPASPASQEFDFQDGLGDDLTFAQTSEVAADDAVPTPAAVSITRTAVGSIMGSLFKTCWLFGMTAIFIAVLANYLRFCFARQRTISNPERVQWQELLHHTGGPHWLPLQLTPALGPMLCLLPRGYEVWIPRLFWQSCSAAEQEAILRHELSHYRRGDVWKTWLMYLLALPQWFNPAAWWAIRNFQQAGEWLCDQEAASALPGRTDYLQALLRLVELQPQTTTQTVAGQCAHAHPLLVRVRRLVSSQPCQDSFMNKLLCTSAVLAAALLPLVRIELVARAADPPGTPGKPPEALLAVKDRMAALDGKLETVKESLAELKKRGEEIKAAVEPKAEALQKLAEDPTQLSDELKEKAKVFVGGDEPTQLAIVKDLGKLASQDEQILALGRVIKDSPHEAVRRLALQTVLTKGEAAYPAIALSFESLGNKDRGFLALELNKLQNNDKYILLLAMAKNADDELIATLIGLDLPVNQRLLLLAGLADSRKDDPKFAEQVIALGDKTAGDDGLLILYAAAKGSSPKNAAAAVKAAVKRKAEAWPVIAAAYKKEDKDCRTAVVRAAKELGGEGGDFLIKAALADADAELRAAAEEAVK